MRSLFPGFYRLTDEEFLKLWANATFVFDTGALLNLYRLSQSGREDFLGVMKKLANRIWIPYQVALEFQRNKQEVIQDQRKKFSEVRDIIESNVSNLRTKLDGLQLRERHSIIKVDEYIAQAEENAKGFLATLGKEETYLNETLAKDVLGAQIDSLFEGRVGPPPRNQKELDQLYDDGAKRYASQIPPGFKDIRKEKGTGGDSYSDGKCVYQRKYGDLLFWKQTICFAKEAKIKELVLVTDDDKEDWWWKIESNGKKTIGPRPELVQEIVAEAGVSLFYMYNSERFLGRASEFLNIPTKEQTIEEIKDVKRVSLKELTKGHTFKLEMAVQEWIDHRFGEYSVETNSDFPDYIVWPDEDTAIGIEVINNLGIHQTRTAIESKLFRYREEIQEVGYSELNFLIVFPNELNAFSFCQYLAVNSMNLPNNVLLHVTYHYESDGLMHLKELR
jgi:hypothetical protein